jgi:tetratricopeptide (TPR) repeat protein
MRAGNATDALRPFTEALALRREASQADPKDWRSASILASGLLFYGRAHATVGNAAVAIPALEESLAMRRDLFARNKRNTGAYAEIGEAAAALADALVPRNKTEAIQLYREAHTILSDLRARSRLTADLTKEPERIEKVLQSLGAATS